MEKKNNHTLPKNCQIIKLKNVLINVTLFLDCKVNEKLSTISTHNSFFKYSYKNVLIMAQIIVYEMLYRYFIYS